MKNSYIFLIILVLSGCSDNVDTIELQGLDEISNPPIVYAGEDVTMRSGEKITLDGSASDSDGNIISYEWIENNETLGTGEKLKDYAPIDVGIHNIQLTVMDDDGLTSSDQVNVTVLDATVTPIANAGDDIIINKDEKVLLDGSDSSDVDGVIRFYKWTESGDILGTGDKLNYLSSVLGVHVIELTVTDDDGLENIDAVNVSIKVPDENLTVVPIANAGDDIIINKDEKVVLDGSDSSASDGVIRFYKWIESGDILGTGDKLNYSSSVLGVHVVELTVTDDDGLENTDIVHVSVKVPDENLTVAPIANAGDDIIINKDEKVVLDGSDSSASDGVIRFYKWTESGDILGTGDKLNYSSSVLGVHVIELTVTDDKGLESRDIIHVSVR